MILYGASGHAKVIIDILKDQNKCISCIFDDDPSKSSFLGYPVINTYEPLVEKDDELIIAIGNNLIRKTRSEIIKHKFGKAVHSSAIVSEYASIGPGTVVMQGSVVQSHASVGRHVIINTSASVDHDCIIDDYVHVSPGSVLCGNVQVGEGSHIGARAVVIPNIKIGKLATIGAGSVIINDVPDYAVVVGNPGKIIKYNSLADRLEFFC